MFRFNQKKANREVDELKKLLAITKGAKATNKSISASFLKEDVGMLGDTNEPPTPETPGEELSPQEEPAVVGTDDTKEIEKAIHNSTVTYAGPMNEEEGAEQIVKGYVSTADDDKGLHFKYSTKENNIK